MTKVFIEVESKKAVAEFRQQTVDQYCHAESRIYTGIELQVDTVDLYLDSLVDHIRYVREAGERLRVSPTQLKMHDQSKFSHAEFPFYAKHFQGGGDPDGFAGAWLHHLHNNPHHWQHWLFPDRFTPKGSKNVENGAVEMPYNYMLEMVADWMGASMAYTGSWDMTDWLYKNMPKITLHSKTAADLRNFLDHEGAYADVVFMQNFAHEIDQQA